MFVITAIAILLFNSKYVNSACCDVRDRDPNKAGMCREGCACCPDGTWVGSWGDGRTYTCNTETLVIGRDDDKFGEICNGCDVFSNRFTVENGAFKDVCGGLSINTNQGTLNSNDEIFEINNGQVLSFTSQKFTDNQFAFVMEAKRTGAASGFDIILGPGDANNQIRYESPNNLGIYSYQESPTYRQSFALPNDIDTLNTIILYYENNALQVYQNNQYVTTINGAFDISTARIGGWYSNRYSADIAVRNIMFSKYVSLEKIRNSLYGTCSGGLVSNALISTEMSDQTVWNHKSESGSFNYLVIIAFFAGMAFTLILNLFCVAFYRFCKKEKDFEQIEMVEDEEIEETKNTQQALAHEI